MNIAHCIFQARIALAALTIGLMQLLGASAANAAAPLGETAPVAPASAAGPTFPTYQPATKSRRQFIIKADLVLAKQIPEWAKSRIAGRHEFVNLCLDRSARYGLRSERSVLAYTYASVWMGRQFEDASAPLLQVLNSGMHEERKAHAMLEWVRDQIKPKATPASGVSAIVGSLDLTEDWDKH